MNIEAIQALGIDDEVPGAAQLAQVGPAQPPQVSFGQLVTGGLQGLNEQLKASQADLQGLALGETQNLHQVMVRLEESRIAFQLMLQVRNRALEAYQEVMRMQV